MRPAAREDVVAEIDERVLLRFPDILESALGIDRRVRPGVTDQGGGFIAKGAAAKEASDIALGLAEADWRHTRCWRVLPGRLMSLGKRNRRGRCLFKRARAVHACVFDLRADEVH